ncbi:MAG: hypothetical protein C0415_01500 [Thermodesulfovibrio sp.]|nr:hypothetical protein [Thermodesulfovibrio sp.]
MPPSLLKGAKYKLKATMIMRVNFKIIVFAVFALLCLFSLSYAESDVDVKEGYDENTEITVKGTVTETMRGMRGPLILKIQSGSKSYTVITAPPWYLMKEGITFNTGSQLEVNGSKYFGRDGNLYIISRQIKDTATGKLIIFRDSYCRPLWNKHGMKNRRFP